MAQVLNKYVPVYDAERRIINGNAYTQPATELSLCILFGDQLTSVPVRGAPALCCFIKPDWIVRKETHQLLVLTRKVLSCVTVSLYIHISTFSIIYGTVYLCVCSLQNRFYTIDIHLLKIKAQSL